MVLSMYANCMHKGEYMRVPDEDSSIRVKRRTSSRLGILQKQLGFHSADEFIATIINVVSRKEWTKADLESLERYGKIIEVIEGTASSDDKMYEALGIKTYTQKDKIKGKVKKKTEKEEKEEVEKQ
jgi:hypothetical protein